MTTPTRPNLRSDASADAAPSQRYFVLTCASCVIATLGLVENSAAVIIGAMIIAPLMGPIQAVAFAGLDGDGRLLRRALLTAGAGALIAIALSWGIGVAVSLGSFGSEVLSRTRPNLLDLGIALAAGAVAGYAKIRPSAVSALAGTAIAVALMPPLCVVGLSLSVGSLASAKGAALLFGTNFLGIALACITVYAISGQFVRGNRVAVITTIALTGALVFPLGASFFSIVRQSQIEAQIRRQLVENTVTFRRVELVAATFDWFRSPVEVELDIRSAGTVSPSQVGDLEKFVADRLGRPVRLVMHVQQYQTVTDGVSAGPSSEPRVPRSGGPLPSLGN